MQNRFLPTALLASSLFIGLGCTKLDTTTLGTDVLTVDNINTFSQEFPIDATQGIFTNDSTIVRKSDNHVIGRITTDAVFGGTDAAIYVQFKPTFYPFYFGNAGDTVRAFGFGYPNPVSIRAGFDSAYLCLSYKGAWGDTSTAGNLPQTFEVSKITDVDFKSKTDTGWVLNKNFTTDGLILGSATLKKQDITQKTVFAWGKDSVENQIRIPLSFLPDGRAYMQSLFNMDSAVNKGFYNDSNFREKSFGFKIKVSSSTGNTLYYVNLTEAKTRLDFVYHRTNAGKVDTVVQSFRMYPAATGNASASSTANYLKRDYTGTGFPASNTITDRIYLQTSPGTFGNLKIPGLNAFKDTNRIIHRAYLVIDQVDAVGTQIYTPPPYLYLDLKDTLPRRYKPVYFDLSNNPYNPDATIVNPLYHPYPNANVDLSLFGGVAMQRYEAGNLFYRYEFNITRYVQHMVTNGYRNFDLRLYAPFTYYYPQYVGTQYVIPYYNPIAAGRVKVGTGIYPDPNHRMKLVVIYSKVQ